MNMAVAVRRTVAAHLLFLPVLVTLPCCAQAWVVPKGETTVSFTYQFADFLGHLDERGRKARPMSGSQDAGVGASRYQALTLEIDHSFSDRFAVTASVPYTATRNGPDASPTSGHYGIDDGRYHMAWQDYHLEGRYNVLMRPVVLTPFLEYVLPSHHYATIGEAGTGRDLQELHAGFGLARVFDPVLPRAYVDSEVAYVFSQKAFGVSTNRTLATLSLGYFVTPRFSVRALGSYQKTHGGLTSDFVFGPDISPALFLNHDRLLQDDHFRAGWAASFSISPHADVYVSAVRTVWGRNTHYGRGFSAGYSRTF